MTYDLGILGGGQLARMSIQAAQRMGLTCVSLDPATQTPASGVAPSIVGSLDDVEAIARIVECCRFVTLENEFISASAIREAFQLVKRSEDVLLPGVDTLSTIQDKLKQRKAYEAAGVPSPRAVSLPDFMTGTAPFDLPVVLKSRYGGYDGKGTRYGRTQDELEASLNEIVDHNEWLAEEFVHFRRELAVMAFVNDTIEGTFPTMVTVQKDSMCDLVYPAESDGAELALAAVQSLKGKGLFGVEMFELEDGTLSINEIAPRPHNSGHYTLDWGDISQFEQHVRIACRLPVTENPRGAAVCMANLIGIENDNFDLERALTNALAIDHVHVHWYGKKDLRKGRKMGHINAVGPHCIERASEARSRFWS